MLGDIKKLRPWPPKNTFLSPHTDECWNFDDEPLKKWLLQKHFLKPNISVNIGGIPVNNPTTSCWGAHSRIFRCPKPRVTFDRRWCWHCRAPADALRWRPKQHQQFPIYVGDWTVGQTSRYPKLAPSVGHEANKACKGHDITATFEFKTLAHGPPMATPPSRI